MKRSTIEAIVEDLRTGRTPALPAAEFASLAPEALAGGRVPEDYLERLAARLGSAELPVFERALRAMDEGDLAWLGFKIVFDPAAAVANVDNEVTKKFGEQGSATGDDLVFFCNDAKEVVAGGAYSPRDLVQMKDVTRGPSMHNDQFEGLTWRSVALFDQVRVWLLGASDVALETAALARHVGFDVTVVDCDPAYLNEERFPGVRRILLPGGTFDGLADLTAAPADYVCVLTRGHMADPESCVWGVRCGAHYVGMMGCAGKNSKVYELVRAAGMTDEDWGRVKRPIGLKFGAKTPAELAISIVAELVDIRYQQRYSEEARARHEASLCR